MKKLAFEAFPIASKPIVAIGRRAGLAGAPALQESASG
ncbi:hypothetical protein J2X90_004639 [Variovorax paradoxus]|nr:hypothetical protein [Variovorax paradoxus]